MLNQYLAGNDDLIADLVSGGQDDESYDDAADDDEIEDEETITDINEEGDDDRIDIDNNDL